MALSARGYIKVLEECGELIQIVSKKLAYWDTDDHPDGKQIQQRIEQEMADVLAAIEITLELNPHLDKDFIFRRQARKVRTFRKWNKPPKRKGKK